MKKSYIVCSIILVILVFVMIIGGNIQDKRLKRKQVEQCAANTMLSVGCVEYNSKSSGKNTRSIPDKQSVGYDSITAAIDRVADSMNLDDATKTKVSEKARTMLDETYYEIEDVQISGRDATVTVCIHYQDHVGELELQYFYYNDEWTLSNTNDVIKSILIDGVSYDISSEDLKEKLKSYFS